MQYTFVHISNVIKHIAVGAQFARKTETEAAKLNPAVRSFSFCTSAFPCSDMSKSLLW